jgi:cytoskeletal protein CcmA (bactofilin family)
MTSTDNEKNERGEPDWSYLEGRPGRDVSIPNLELGNGGTAKRGRPIEGKILTIGRETKLSGDVTECELLIVEGNIEKSNANAKSMEISQTGSFTGTAVLEEAKIGGIFDGNLKITGKLHITNTGRVSGKIKYSTLEIENGGQIIGDIKLSNKK